MVVGNNGISLTFEEFKKLTIGIVHTITDRYLNYLVPNSDDENICPNCGEVHDFDEEEINQSVGGNIENLITDKSSETNNLNEVETSEDDDEESDDEDDEMELIHFHDYENSRGLEMVCSVFCLELIDSTSEQLKETFEKVEKDLKNSESIEEIKKIHLKIKEDILEEFEIEKFEQERDEKNNNKE